MVQVPGGWIGGNFGLPGGDTGLVTRTENPARAGAPAAREQGARPSREPDARQGRRRAVPDTPVVPVFARLVSPLSPGDPSSVPVARTGLAGTGRAQLVGLGSSASGVHAATLRVQGARGDELRVSIVVTGARVDVRIEAPDDAAASWLRGRARAVEQALAASGLVMGRLDLGSGAPKGQEHGTSGQEGRRDVPKDARSPGYERHQGGWTL